MTRLGLGLLLWLALGSPAVAAASDIKIATWNLEWLIEPKELRRLAPRCVPDGELPRGAQRVVPCRVARELERSAADFRALAKVTAQLDADVIAIQEVDGPEPAARVFPGYRFCFSARRHVQNLGFAVRRGLPYRCSGDLRELSLRETVRRGVELTLWPGESREMRFLSVHLKSGCGRRALDHGKEECSTLAQQVPLLEQWIDAQAQAGRRFAVLGDFNRDLDRDRGMPRNEQGQIQNFWAEIDDADPPGSDLTLAAQLGEFRNCSAVQNFSGYIDQIVLGRDLAAQILPQSFERVGFDAADALRRRLSDHCPVAIRLRIDGKLR